jgi:hypothetical protein
MSDRVPEREQAGRRRPRVAVIAVHGVADQRPHDSAHQVAGLLGRLKPEGSDQRFCYSPFVRRDVTIPVARLAPQAGHHVGTLSESAESRDPEPLDLRFMDGLLEGHRVEGDDAAYRTVRLDGRRRPAGGDGAADVHVYEMYWADLSRLGHGVFRIFGELYQLLLHVGSLGTHVASAAAGERREPVVRIFKRSVEGSAWVLAGPIAIFSLYMVGAALLVVAGLLGPYQKLAAIVLTTATLGVAGGVLLLRARRLHWLASLAVLVLIGLAALAQSVAPNGPAIAHLLGVTVLVVAVVLLGWVSAGYHRYRPGAVYVSAPGLALVAATGFISLIVERNLQAPLVRAGFRIVEVLFALLVVSWSGLILFLWTAVASGAIWWWSARREPAVGRAVWTAWLALGLGAAGFLVTTVLLGTAAYLVVGENRLIPEAPYEALAVSRGWLDRRVDLRDFVSTVLAQSGGAAFVPMLLALGLAVLVAAWALGPVVWSEVRPPRDHRRAADLGRWVTNAFPLLNAAGVLVFVAVAVLLPAGTVAEQWLVGLDAWLDARLADAGLSSRAIQGALAALVLGPGAGLLLGRGRLDVLAAGFRAPLDVALDVDNYLREYPRGQTPRARLCARYWSLLQHIRRAAVPYDALVIVAHSQGSVLTADLFRYLHRHGAVGLPPVFLFTMGCPLRQLYGWRFPHLYGWARHESDQPATRASTIPADQRPHPGQLGVRRWVNAYRSGDYVGRWLWQPDRCGDHFEPAGQSRAGWHPRRDLHDVVGARDARGSRREFCIGAGAHMHYWDDTAAEIAVELDALIADAARAAAAVSGRPD